MATRPPRKATRLHLYDSDDYRALVRRVQGNLRRLRESRDWTQEEAGTRCSMPMQQYQRTEAADPARANLTLTTIARLCRGFEVDASALFAAPPASPSPILPP